MKTLLNQLSFASAIALTGVSLFTVLNVHAHMPMKKLPDHIMISGQKTSFVEQIALGRGGGRGGARASSGSRVSSDGGARVSGSRQQFSGSATSRSESVTRTNSMSANPNRATGFQTSTNSTQSRQENRQEFMTQAQNQKQQNRQAAAEIYDENHYEFGENVGNGEVDHPGALGVATGLAIGALVNKPPENSEPVVVNDQQYYYSDGQYFAPNGNGGYQVVAAPAGAPQQP